MNTEKNIGRKDIVGENSEELNIKIHADKSLNCEKNSEENPSANAVNCEKNGEENCGDSVLSSGEDNRGKMLSARVGCNNIIKRLTANRVTAFFGKYSLIFYGAVFLIFACVMRAFLFNHRSGDFNNFLSPWLVQMKKLGVIKGIASDMGDYTPAYKYIVALISLFSGDGLYAYKIVSCLFDVALAVITGFTVRKICNSDIKGLAAYVVVLFLPTVFLNSAAWGQCDGIFTFFVVLSFYFALFGKSRLSGAMFGCAFAFKIQSVFYLPVFAVFILRKKISPTALLYFVGAYVLWATPAIICGMNVIEALGGAYAKQIGEYSMMTLGAPNIYQILPDKYTNSDVGKAAVFLACGIIALYALLIFKSPRENNDKTAVIGAYLLTLVAPYVLPHMHERYFYLSDIFAVIFAFCFVKKSYISTLSLYASMRTVVKTLYDGSATKVAYVDLAIVMLAAIALLSIFAYSYLTEKDCADNTVCVKSERV